MGTSYSRRKSASKSKDDQKNNQPPRQSLEQKADSIQMVLPRIYMGSAVSAKNFKLLTDNKITHIVAIGWNLQIHFPDKFEYLLLNRVEDRPSYLILNHFEKCIKFMNDGFKNNQNCNLFVHCHKGLSRSATIIIAFEMWKNQKPFASVLHDMRDHRSFIMPNIGFQAQLKAFEDNNYSLDIVNDYNNFNVLEFISHKLPGMLNKIQTYYKYFQIKQTDKIDDEDLFSITMYIHQVHKLRERKKLNDNDINVLNDSINYLRKIQVEFIKDDASINRFNMMFTSKINKQKPIQQPTTATTAANDNTDV